jgi:small subunit ribosomal protein S9
MAISIASLTTSLSSLSFSSQISQKPNTLSFSRSNSLSFPLSHPSKQPLTLRVSATVSSPETTTTTTDLKKLVKSRLPGGFAAQTIHGTGRRKCAIARVVLQEGTGKVIINYRDAKVNDNANSPSLLHFLSIFLLYDCFKKWVLII